MSKKLIVPPYRIETERLVIRCYNPEDVWKLEKAISSSLKSLGQWMPWIQLEPQTVDARMELLRNFRGRFDKDLDYIYGVFNKDESRVVGGTGLHTRRGDLAFEIGYWTATDMEGQGIATEVSKVLTNVGLNYCGRHRIEIMCDPQNAGSKAIPKKLGFTHEVTRRDFHPPVVEGDPFCDTMIWTLQQPEWADWPHKDFPMKAYDAAGRQVI